MNKKKLHFSRLAGLCLAATTLLGSCGDADMVGSDSPDVYHQKLSLPYQKQLNVIYFLPNDMEPHLDYERRLSGALKHMQNYYAQQLLSHGFGNRTFGLAENPEVPGNVNIKIIHAENDHLYYPYSNGGNRAVKEIKAYFEEHPEEKTSEHFLIFIPRHEDGTGVPFYGLGKFAFTRDYPGGYDMDKWVDGVGFPTIDDKWIGGTIHELGHGLNLPHNRQKVSDNFTAMMGNGNSSYWKSPNSIKFTKASALILRYNELFTNNAPFEFYQEVPEVEIKHQRIYADSEYLYVQTKFTSTIPVKGAIVYNDPKTGPNDKDYNAITWATRDIMETANADSVSFKMALSDIDENFKEHPFTLKLSFVHENGRIVANSYPYNFVNGQPDIDVNEITYDDLDKTNWSVVDFSSQEDDFEDSGWGYHLIDNDISTVWHSGWYGSVPTPPHHITVDMGSIIKLHGISIIQNQKATNAMLKNFTVFVSEDNTSWTNAGDYLATTNTGRQQFIFPASLNARFVKIVAHDSYGSPVGVRIAELGAF
ncbi:discoidin domain-containing protein [Echinicola shivajiensis]|uniref:discoidin domain-containing protein n=1 Tax=Echinicola shivajiensis TaxID=1035916 RepID=UPI001BFC51D2|nr:discoidin domain-containing protein [Echinicola shivajiensis]